MKAADSPAPHSHHYFLRNAGDGTSLGVCECGAEKYFGNYDPEDIAKAEAKNHSLLKDKQEGTMKKQHRNQKQHDMMVANRDAIMADAKSIGFNATCKKWGIAGSSLHKMKKEEEKRKEGILGNPITFKTREEEKAKIAKQLGVKPEDLVVRDLDPKKYQEFDKKEGSERSLEDLCKEIRESGQWPTLKFNTKTQKIEVAVARDAQAPESVAGVPCDPAKELLWLRGYRQCVLDLSPKVQPGPPPSSPALDYIVHKLAAQPLL